MNLPIDIPHLRSSCRGSSTGGFRSMLVLLKSGNPAGSWPHGHRCISRGTALRRLGLERPRGVSFSNDSFSKHPYVDSAQKPSCDDGASLAQHSASTAWRRSLLGCVDFEERLRRMPSNAGRQIFSGSGRGFTERRCGSSGLSLSMPSILARLQGLMFRVLPHGRFRGAAGGNGLRRPGPPRIATNPSSHHHPVTGGATPFAGVPS